jgi:beta-galactosidase
MIKRDIKYLFLTLPVILAIVTGCDRGHEPGMPVSFNEDWLFIRQDSANIDKILPGIIPNHKWEDVALPHTAFIEPLVISGSQWTGICWYKKLYRAPRGDRRRNTGLLFDGAMNDAIIYLNGVEVIRHTGGYLPFYVDLTNDLKYGKENEILVKLDNRDNPEIPPGKPLSELDFLYYGGLYRNVSLCRTNKLHITAAPETHALLGGGIITGVRDISRESAIVTVSVEVINDDKIPRTFYMKNTLLDAGGTEKSSSLSEKTELEPGQSQRLMTKIIVMHPALWSPDTPFLYTLRTQLQTEKEVVDSKEMRVGIRSLKITADKGLQLNGERLTVTGTNRHQEYPYIGYALSDNASYRDAYKIREAGFNLVRCSHYPPAPAFLDACDELGLMVINAIPGWQFMGDSLFREASLRDTRMMCRRDRNHPSVVMWESSLNETVMPVQFLSMLHETVKNELPYRDNYTCSWMDTICDVFIPARQDAQAPDYWKKYHKTKPIFISEYGDWEYYANNARVNQNEFSDLEPSARSSRQLRSAGERALLQQAFNFQEAHNDNLYGPCFGDANWLMFDYNRGYAPDIASSGIMDIFRLPKFSYWFYRSQADEGPVCFIADYSQPLSITAIRVFSNADSVQLYRNDTLLAVKAPDRNRNTVNLKHPPFTFTLLNRYPGTLKAVGLKNGSIFGTHSVSTTGPLASLRLSIDISNKPLSADGSDAVFVYATLVDSIGNQVFTADSTVRFSVRGDAVLVGDNPVKAEAGIATILLKAGHNPGQVMVTASSGNLAEAEIMTPTRHYGPTRIFQKRK